MNPIAKNSSSSRARSVRTWLWLSLLVIGLVLLTCYIWYHIETKAVGAGASQDFTIASGESSPQVATSLATAKLIRNSNAFLTYLNFHHLRPSIKAGTYALSPGDNVAKIVAIITTSSSLGRLSIPEGYTITQIEASVAQHGIPVSAFKAALAETHTQSGLSQKPKNVDLEGYLFPDSYSITPGVTTASILVNNMLDDFTQRVGNIYDQSFASEGLTRHQGLTLASIVEREVNRSEDRPVVAQVFLKRLQLGMPLGSDVTVQYAADQLGTSFSTSLNSPYNTYLHAGLPPGPIANPGLSSLDAVAHPAATNYLYFVAGTDGVTHFSTTYAEHQQNVAKYLK
jgi:UPF0755 protein